MTSGHITCTTTLSSSDLSYISLCQIESLSSHLNESAYPPLPVARRHWTLTSSCYSWSCCCSSFFGRGYLLYMYNFIPVVPGRWQIICFFMTFNRYCLVGRYVTEKNLYRSTGEILEILVGRFVCWGWRSFEVFLLGYTNWYNGGYYCVYIYPDDRYKQQTRWDWKAIICAHT